MDLCDVYLSLGEDTFSQLLKRISISRLRTYQIYEHIKVRTHLTKLNSESLRKATPRLWSRLSQRDLDLASDLAQAILVSNLEMIIAALDFLGIPHQDGFFAKDADIQSHLGDGWQQRTYDALKEKFAPPVLRFYLNHLAVETGLSGDAFNPEN